MPSGNRLAMGYGTKKRHRGKGFIVNVLGIQVFKVTYHHITSDCNADGSRMADESIILLKLIYNKLRHIMIH